MQFYRHASSMFYDEVWNVGIMYGHAGKFITTDAEVNESKRKYLRQNKNQKKKKLKTTENDICDVK